MSLEIKIELFQTGGKSASFCRVICRDSHGSGFPMGQLSEGPADRIQVPRSALASRPRLGRHAHSELFGKYEPCPSQAHARSHLHTMTGIASVPEF